MEASGPTAMATLTFRGLGVAWVTRAGPGYGQADVELDGRKAISINTALFPRDVPRTVFQWSWETPGLHTVTLHVVPTEPRTPVGLDAFLILA